MDMAGMILDGSSRGSDVAFVMPIAITQHVERNNE
jgi:hypothetical protein